MKLFLRPCAMYVGKTTVVALTDFLLQQIDPGLIDGDNNYDSDSTIGEK